MHNLKKKRLQNVTVFQSNTGLFSVDVVENSLVSDLAFRCQAYQAPYIRIRRRIRSRSRRRRRTASILRRHNRRISGFHPNKNLYINPHVYLEIETPSLNSKSRERKRGNDRERN